jgi:hypothetical protein
VLTTSYSNTKNGFGTRVTTSQTSLEFAVDMMGIRFGGCLDKGLRGVELHAHNFIISMSPSPQKKNAKRSPCRTRSLDKTQHYRLRIPDEEDLFEVVGIARRENPKKSVSFAEDIAIDAETGKKFESFTETRMALARSFRSKGTMTPFEQAAQESVFWRQFESSPEKEAGKRKGRKNCILRGWSKLHRWKVRKHSKLSAAVSA